MKRRPFLTLRTAAYALAAALLAGLLATRHEVESHWLKNFPDEAAANSQLAEHGEFGVYDAVEMAALIPITIDLSEPASTPPGPLPELPPDLGRIRGRVVLASRRLRDVAAERMADWKTAVFVEQVPEDRWRAAWGGEPLPARTSSILRERPRPESWIISDEGVAFVPPILFCRPGDSFRLITRDRSDRSRKNHYDLRTHEIPVYAYESVSEGAWHRGLDSWWLDLGYNAFAPHRIRGEDILSGLPCEYGLDEQGRPVRAYALPWQPINGSGGIDLYDPRGVEPFFTIAVQNPYHAFVDTAGDGTFVFDRIPPGLYWVRTFDPFFDTIRYPIRVHAGRVSQLELVIDQRQILRFHNGMLGLHLPPSPEEVADELVADPGCLPACLTAGIGSGTIEGRIVLAEPELAAIARERPPVYPTAVFVETIDFDTWQIARAYPPDRPLELSLTRQYAGQPHIEESANWVYQEGVVQIVGFRDCLRLAEPTDYSRVRMHGPWVVPVETFDPSGGRIFLGHRDPSLLADEEDCVQSRPETNLILDPFLTHPLRRSLWGNPNRDPGPEFQAARRSGRLEFPLLRSQGWGRVECLYRPRDARSGWDSSPGDQAPLYIVGAQNPFHALANIQEGGTFRIPNVPEGTFWIRTFDAHFRTTRQQVTVKAGEVSSIEIVLSARRE